MQALNSVWLAGSSVSPAAMQAHASYSEPPQRLLLDDKKLICQIDASRYLGAGKFKIVCRVLPHFGAQCL